MPHRRRQRRASGRGRLLWALVVSMIVQLPLLALFASYVETDGVAPEKQPTRLRLVGFAPAPPPDDEKPEEIPEDAQVVELPPMPDPEPDPEPREVKHVADRKVRVKKQTKSRRKAPANRARQPGQVDVKEPSRIQAKSSKSPDPTTTDKEPQDVAMAGARSDRPTRDSGKQAPKSAMRDGDKADILMPVTTERSRIANLQGMSGDFTSDDHLPHIKEQARHTMLDADKYKFSDFFYRVKEAVRRHWHPDRIFRMRDPTGRVFGVKDRYTVLKVTLDPAGRLKKTVTMRRSGLDFMDAEAHSAFTRAKHFPNPPRGLVDESGEINFQFGFYFEIGTGRTRFRPKRL